MALRPEENKVRKGTVFFVPVELTDPEGVLQPYREEEIKEKL